MAAEDLHHFGAIGRAASRGAHYFGSFSEASMAAVYMPTSRLCRYHPITPRILPYGAEFSACTLEFCSA
jgi:hypothetical protein